MGEKQLKELIEKYHMQTLNTMDKIINLIDKITSQIADIDNRLRKLEEQVNEK